MPTRNPLKRFGIVPVLLVGLVCYQFLTSWGIAIPLINARYPSTIAKLPTLSKRRSLVYVQGTVTKLAPFLDAGAYQLEDETGKIWVFTQQPLPNEGDEILIRGKLRYESIFHSGEDWGEYYLVESQKLAKETPPEPTVEELLLPHKERQK